MNKNRTNKQRIFKAIKIMTHNYSAFRKYSNPLTLCYAANLMLKLSKRKKKSFPSSLYAQYPITESKTRSGGLQVAGCPFGSFSNLHTGSLELHQIDH